MWGRPALLGPGRRGWAKPLARQGPALCLPSSPPPPGPGDIKRCGPGSWALRLRSLRARSWAWTGNLNGD